MFTKDNFIELGNGVKTNIKATADLQALAKDAYDHGDLTAEKTSKLIVEASERLAKATTESAQLNAKAQLDYLLKLEENLKVKEKTIKAEAAYENKFNEKQIDTYKEYTTSTMQKTFEEKVNNLNEKADNYIDKKTLETDKKFISKDVEAEKYGLDRTLSTTTQVSDFAKDATNKAQSAIIKAQELQLKATEEKGLAEIEITKWRLYKKTFKSFRIANYIFWPLLGVVLGVVVALIILKVSGFMVL